MNFWREIRGGIAILLVAALACPPAHALVTLNDSHDHIYVNGSFSASHDSNIFAQASSDGDYVYTTGLSVEYQRRAGWIGVNASVSMSAARYGKLVSENFSNPSYSMELTKQSGRTTGSLTLAGARESRADSAVNIRSMSWNYTAGLNFKYPISERYTMSGSFAYNGRKYIEQTNLVDLSTYSANVDLFYVFANERDLIAGYRYRYSETSRDTASVDHALTVGMNGRIIRGVNGTVRVGYQTRTLRPRSVDGGGYSGLTASASTSYAVNRKLSFSGSLSKDFTTTATDTSVDTTAASLDGTYARNVHWTYFAGLGWGDTRFLGEKGRVVLSPGNPTATPPVPATLGRNRHDNYATWSAGAGYSLNEHFRATFTYAWFKNWSTLAFSDFERTSWTLSLTSRW